MADLPRTITDLRSSFAKLRKTPVFELRPALETFGVVLLSTLDELEHRIATLEEKHRAATT